MSCWTSCWCGWEDQYNAGRDLSPEELCRDSPHLAERAAQEIANLKQMRAARSTLPIPPPTPPISPSPPPVRAFAELTAEAARFAAGAKIGPYCLLEFLGRGAFGEVWLAERDSTIAKSRLAVKLSLHASVDLAAIRTEAELWVRAGNHPNVLPMFEAEVYDAQVVIVSEYAPDGCLKRWLDRHGGKAPSFESAGGMAMGILAGLEHLHVRGIVHRDLKPANVLMQGECPRIADFGLARVLDPGVTVSRAAGTPAYMAPEAFDGRRSAQTDLWSVGVILYQLARRQLAVPVGRVDASGESDRNRGPRTVAGLRAVSAAVDVTMKVKPRPP